MIFFEENINSFTVANGMQVTPIPCELNDSRQGFYLGEDWKEEIEAKGATVELIEKEDLKIKEI